MTHLSIIRSPKLVVSTAFDTHTPRLSAIKKIPNFIVNFENGREFNSELSIAKNIYDNKWQKHGVFKHEIIYYLIITHPPRNENSVCFGLVFKLWV